MLVEVCANSLESAINAEKAGADRIELCSELGVGGITPSYGLLQQVMEEVTIPVHVLIRPRSGDFSYSEAEFRVMLKDIEFCKSIGVKGIVSGALKPDFSLDKQKTSTLIKTSEGMHFTFHRAFDWLKDPLESFKIIQDLGADHLLTSGQQPKAIEGIDLLKQLLKVSDSCKIMPGGGVNSENIESFKNAGFEEIHFSGTIFYKTLPQLPKISMNSEKFLKEDHKAISDVRIIREMIQKLK
ncbi:copper homeostasis protein CutC [Christiangramia fulva]|uniref:PF03932 family protein CutC n=1 Tax=Christiangramia fulva TaxID=2126553 RepID=A0A2R3Z4U7_9FLAO|nr:copper homeostasis protein CutC [Christiangramia fulva]AVR45258.1 copper homeostasis protein CutC [Christiangramia fulva]